MNENKTEINITRTEAAAHLTNKLKVIFSNVL